GSLPQTKENLESVSQYTNIHYHGFNVSPLLGADDVLVDVPSNVTPKPVEFSQTPSPTPITIPVQDSLTKKAKLYTEGVTTGDTYKLIPVPPLGDTTPDSTTGTSGNLPGGYYPGDDPAAPKYGGPITDYEMGFLIPDVHQSGLFWYHSHAHSLSQQQVRGGLSGGIIIKGNDEYYGQFLLPAPPTPEMAAGARLKSTFEEPEFEANSLSPKIAQQVITFKDFNDVLDPNNVEDCFILNSKVNPKITIKPGEIQLWRIANIGSDQYMNIALETIPNLNPTNQVETNSLEIENVSIDVGGETGTITGTGLSTTIELSASTLGSVANITGVDVDNANITDVEITSANLGNIVIDEGTATITGDIQSGGQITATVNEVPNQTGTITDTTTGTIEGNITNTTDIAIPEFTQPWGNSNFYILARDGDVVEHPVATDSILLPPAVRAEFLVVGGEPGTTYNLVSDLDTDLTTQQQQWANGLQSYLLATVEVEDTDLETYTYKQGTAEELTVSVCDGTVDEPTNTCTGGTTDGNTDLDYFIKNQAPYKIDDILPEPDVVASLPPCNSLPQNLTTQQRKKLLALVNGDRKKLKSLLSLNCITQPDAYENPLTKKRYFYFSSGDGKFFLKGFETQAEAETGGNIDTEKIKELFDGNRIDKISQVGDIEEWNLVNTDGFAHVFHIHQLDFVVTEVTLPSDPGDTYNNYEIDGACTPGAELPDGTSNGYHCTLKTQGYRDVFNLPGNSITTVRIPFVNPFITGVFVYHCHILGHEDRGMMNNLKVINPKGFNEAEMKQLKRIIEFFRNNSKN
ncbi:MAG: multicopper oxidase domain-containing protein, partial [Moorea sp. SIO3G5]|nr:multicopper oxidase domain-containing protein [Moorena sp. SIO3G5]